MIINHNMGAANAIRQMGVNQTNANKSMEKLSSGLKINKAGDDAAGLAISEKMRGQIRGLDQASANAQDGISLIQTAEGGLSETHSILQRMRELAVQSSTDTNVETDRKAIQAEMNQLTEEIDRISNNTEFNTQNLLNGSFSGKFQIGANEKQTVSLQINKMDTASLGLTSTNSIESDVSTNLKDGVYTVSGANLLDVEGNVVGKVATSEITSGDGSTKTTFSKADLADKSIITVKDGKADVKNSIKGKAEELTLGNYEIKNTNVFKDGKQVGTVTAEDTLSIDGVGTITAGELGFKATKINASTNDIKFTINGSDVSSSATAESSITSINKAIETVSTERSKLGAMQNRLEHTIANLGTSSENLTSAESRIRDVDMAKEMSQFSKNNILSQAAQAMLAQANQQPQQVLQLLR